MVMEYRHCSLDELQFFKNCILFIYFVYVCRYIHATMHVFRSENNLESQISPSIILVLEIESRPSGLVASMFSLCAIFLTTLGEL